MKVVIGQFDVIAGDPKANVDKMKGIIQTAKAEEADLVVFPEMCVGGYLLGDLWLDDSYCRYLMSFNEELREASDGIAIIYGNIYLQESYGDNGEWHPNEDGRLRRYNAAYIWQNGKPVIANRYGLQIGVPANIQIKTLLPNYRFFDDKRYFYSLLSVALDFKIPLECLYEPVRIRVKDEGFVNIGVELCEDLWVKDYRYDNKPLNPTKMLVDNGAQIIVNLSASPWTYGKHTARDNAIKFLAKECGYFPPFIYVNCVGVQNNGKDLIAFDGGSTVYGHKGLATSFGSSNFTEHTMIEIFQEWMGEYSNVKGDRLGLFRIEPNKIAQKYEAILYALIHFVSQMGLKTVPKWILGLSGGIDSAVVTCLLERAFGAHNILTVNLPSEYNSEKTRNSAAYIAQALRLLHYQIGIDELSKLNVDTVNGIGKNQVTDFNYENIQAKIRGTSIISNLAAKEGAFFTNNGNKVEMFFGYATLYGDVGGAIAPIADLTKSEVYALGKYLNEHVYMREVIPSKLFPDNLHRFSQDGIAPSAELKTAQIDPMKFGYHCAIVEAVMDYKTKTGEALMQAFLDGTLEIVLTKDDVTKVTTELLERWGVTDAQVFLDDLDDLLKKKAGSVFKRIQSPPLIVTSKSAFGYDYRESILPYASLKEMNPKLYDAVLAKGKYEASKIQNN